MRTNTSALPIELADASLDLEEHHQGAGHRGEATDCRVLKCREKRTHIRGLQRDLRQDARMAVTRACECCGQLAIPEDMRTNNALRAQITRCDDCRASCSANQRECHRRVGLLS